MIINHIIETHTSLSRAFWAVLMRLGSAVKVGGTYLLKIVDRFKDLRSLEDYFSPNKLVIAIIETLLAERLLSFMIMLTNW